MNIRMKTAALAVVAAVALVSCESPAEKTDSKPESTAPKTVRLTAEAASKKLANVLDVASLGNPQDKTSGCSNKAANKKPHENDCRQLITTNMVSIYEFATPQVAARWVKGMSKVGDWRQVGRFALAWTARDQKLTPEGRRNELETAMKKIVAEES